MAEIVLINEKFVRISTVRDVKIDSNITSLMKFSSFKASRKSNMEFFEFRFLLKEKKIRRTVNLIVILFL